MQSRRHRNRGLRLYDFNVPVVPLPRLRDIYWRGVGLGDAMFGLLQRSSILCMPPRQLHLPILGPRGWDTSTSGSMGALQLMGVRGSPDASANDNNHKKRWPPPLASVQHAGVPRKDHKKTTQSLSYLPTSDPGTTYGANTVSMMAAAATEVDGPRRKRARLDKVCVIPPHPVSPYANRMPRCVFHAGTCLCPPVRFALPRTIVGRFRRRALRRSP